MTIIDVRAVAGRYCLTMTEGQNLYDAIHPWLRKKQAVELDFSGVTMYASPFFNAAVGQLAKDFPAEAIATLLYVRGLSTDGMLVLRRSLDNAVLYYAEQKTRQAWDESTAI